MKYPVVFMDVELPGIAPAPDNGWNSACTSPCSGRVSAAYIPAAADCAVIDGFAAYLTSHSSYKPGVYSSPTVRAAIFGTGVSSQMTSTYEWTYTGDTSSLSYIPDGSCRIGASTRAQFFGAIIQSSPYALIWQWSGDETYGGYGDFDQIGVTRSP